LLREYIDTPKELIFEKHFTADNWGLTDILKAADRRLGRGKLRTWRDRMEDSPALKVLHKRLSESANGER
jgi:hypothetical protein